MILRGVQVHSTARINPGAIFEPSGGKIIIGALTSIDRGVILRGLGGTIENGDDCSVNAYSVLQGGGGLQIGNKTRIAHHTVITPANHIFSNRTKQTISESHYSIRCEGTFTNISA